MVDINRLSLAEIDTSQKMRISKFGSQGIVERNISLPESDPEGVTELQPAMFDAPDKLLLRVAVRAQLADHVGLVD
jgi:hypothetical protein